MPLTFYEKVESRKWNTGDNASVDLFYDLEGTSSDTFAKTLAESSTPTTYEGLVRHSINLEPVWVDTTAADGHWLVTVRYSVQDPASGGDSTFCFDTSGGTQHITQSKEPIGRYAPAGIVIVPDHKGAIGYNGETVEGVDITVPVYTWGETHYLADILVTWGYRGTLFGLTGRTNDAPFKGFAAGECLFLGAAGSKRAAEEWEISFRFAGSPNVADACADWDATIKPAAAVPKKGWEYLWVQYADCIDATANPKRKLKRPVGVYVERVYPSGNFAGLGIGV